MPIAHRKYLFKSLSLK